VELHASTGIVMVSTSVILYVMSIPGAPAVVEAV
jgi:hypothetical protein